LAAGPRLGWLNVTTTSGTSFRIELDGLGLSGTTNWSMTSDSGDYIGGGANYKYTPATATLTYRGVPQHVSASVNGANGDWWYADFVPAQGDIITVGTYPSATRYPFNGSGPGLSIYGNGRGCNTLTGSFTVTSVAFSTTTGDLTRLDLSFEQHCEGAAPALRGRLKYRASLDVTAPPPVSGLMVNATGSTANLTWKNPTVSDLSYTMVRALVDNRGVTLATSGIGVTAGTATAVTTSGLDRSRPWTFTVFAVDTHGNVSAPASVTLAASPAAFLLNQSSASQPSSG
jgi:hypothetical protein